MILLGKPSDISGYIVVNSEKSYELHSKGFFPKYKNGGEFYYVKTPALEEFLKKGGN